MPGKLGFQEDSPRVVISILNWNGWGDTIKCLESVRRLDYANYVTVLVDNGSTNDSTEKLREYLAAQRGYVEYTTEAALQGGSPGQETALEALSSKDRIILIRNRDNLGFAGGNNVAIQYGLRRPQAADFVFLLNNDATVDKDCLDHLIHAGFKAGAGIMGAVIKDTDTGHAYFTGWVGSFPLLRQFFPLS